ncbi:MAG: DUF4340 domain-containing protein [SAR324 cluster bacterium]|nr:DUF4340 domain-containing protein [SAR324 cluster bacterium]
MLKKMILVTLLLVILSGVALMVSQKKSESDPREGQSIMKTVDINELSRILIQGKNTPVELEKNENQQWLVKSDHYLASSEELQKLLVKFMEAKIGHKVTDNPQHHEKFRVLHIEQNNGQWDAQKTGTLVRLLKQDGSPVLEVILGKDRVQGGGQYFRYAGDNSVFLILQNLIVPTDSEEWLDKLIIDLDAKKLVKTISVTPSDNDSYVLTRDKDAEWQTTLTGQESLKQDDIGTLLDQLKDLQFLKLMPVSTLAAETGRERVTTLEFENFDGRILLLAVGEDKVSSEDYHYIHVSMKLGEGVTDDALKQEVDTFNARTQNWLYGLSYYKGTAFLKHRSDLVKTSGASE